MEKVVYREGRIWLADVKRAHEQGVVHTCSHCGAVFTIAFSDEEIAKDNGAKGIFCPNDLRHVNVRISPRRTTLSR